MPELFCPFFTCARLIIDGEQILRNMPSIRDSAATVNMQVSKYANMHDCPCHCQYIIISQNAMYVQDTLVT